MLVSVLILASASGRFMQICNYSWKTKQNKRYIIEELTKIKLRKKLTKKSTQNPTKKLKRREQIKRGK